MARHRHAATPPRAEGARTVGGGAGFAGDRVDPAVALAASGLCDAVVLECLAERTLVPGLRARRANAEAGADPRLRRRLAPLLGPARASGSRIISNLGAANPVAAARAVAALAGELGLAGLRVAAVLGDDVLAHAADIAWSEPIEGTLLGAHAYLGADALAPAVDGGAEVIVTGRTADSALFAAELVPVLDGREDALAGALAVGHLLECGGQVSGGNFEGPDGESLAAAAFASLGYPLAAARSDGSAELFLLDAAPGRLDRLTCTLQLLYEVHDPARYITPDLVVDMTGMRIEEAGRNRVRVSGARARGRPAMLKVSGFVERPGMIADVEIGFAGTRAEARARLAADVLRLRLADLPEEDVRIDLVGIDSILGGARAGNVALPECRVHVSARCPDADAAQAVEDEVYALTLSGPAGGAGIRSERRPRLDVVDGLIDRALIRSSVVWEAAR
jgi:hypothetical protein